jgi:putative ABC transport system substrate-binding protein
MFNLKKSLVATAVFALMGAASMLSAHPMHGNRYGNRTVQIAVVEPLQHEAMNEIINGYKDGLKQAHINAHVVVKNGQLDPNIERAIFKQLSSDRTDIVAPIGTSLFEMATTTITHKPIVGIATSVIPNAQLQAMHPVHATVISDSINPTDQVRFMHKVLPHMKKMTIVYSADDNIVQQVNQIIPVAAKFGIKVQKLMVTSAPDLYTIAHHIDHDSSAIFVLKDHMIVSGVAQLAQQAQSLGMPLITSDDGSVQGGGAFAFGITERQIGEASAKVTAQYIMGTPMSQLPVKTLTDYRVFLNTPMALKEGMSSQELHNLVHLAHMKGYQVIGCTAKSCKS